MLLFKRGFATADASSRGKCGGAKHQRGLSSFDGGGKKDGRAAPFLPDGVKSWPAIDAAAIASIEGPESFSWRAVSLAHQQWRQRRRHGHLRRGELPFPFFFASGSG